MLYEDFIAISRYARWLPEHSRRETWAETCRRYTDFWQDKGLIDQPLAEEIYNAIYNKEVMPSMRALMTAGVALETNNIAGYNCAYTAINRIEAFDEIMYILMNGTGVGFSCERQEICFLPSVPATLTPSNHLIIVGDSKEGWATALRGLITNLYNGIIPKWDVSLVRPAGAPLNTFGGRASGAAPLVGLFQHTVDTFTAAQGRKLNSIEVHSIVCKIAEIVVVGGVRRSALISLSNFSDQRMAKAKTGKWWESHPEFALANNSICYTEKPDAEAFLREWLNLIESKSGERGIFNREAANNIVKSNPRRQPDKQWGCNPCSEIILQPEQMCNLSEVVIRPEDTKETLIQKTRIATILGTLQATLTDFKYLGSTWRSTVESERLLGVSLTGIMDNPITAAPSRQLTALLSSLKQTAITTNHVWATKLKIKVSAAITTVKPSGTVSQLVNCASGIHSRYAPYYIRTVRAGIHDPLTSFMIEQGFPWELDVMSPTTNVIFSFPIKSPDNAVFRDDKTAIEQLELWLHYQLHWCEHKPSITVFVRDEEWLDVGAWVYRHFDLVSGISFLPHSDHTYVQAPYQEITEAEYIEWVAKMPTQVDWTQFTEQRDNSVGTQTLACAGGNCEL